MARNLSPELTKTVHQLVGEFDFIPAARKKLLYQLTEFVRSKSESKHPVNLNFICTHNSRRSHLAQIWAQTAAHYYGVSSVFCFSGGTEATAFNPRAVKAMQEAGFAISTAKDGTNPVYEVRFSVEADPVIAFSKVYDDPFNPDKDFAAVMTCTHADQNCPLVLGASARIALTYDDPKDFDGTPQESAKYRGRVHEIGREILYAFSQV
jgi:arsenate reductase